MSCNFLIVKQEYLQDLPTYTLYKRESKWLGLKHQYKSYAIEDVAEGWRASFFRNMTILVGMLTRHLYKTELKYADCVDRKKMLECIRNNTKIALYIKSPYDSDKPKFLGVYTINEYLTLKNKRKNGI